MKQLPDLSPPQVTQHAARNGWQRLRVALAWGVLGVCMVGVLAWAAVHAFIVPRINDYRQLLQHQASRAIGTPVEIGHIQAQGGWWVLGFEVSEVLLLDAQGQEALRLPRVWAALSLRSLLQGGFEQLAIDQPELDMRRDGDGKLWIAGLSSQGDGNGAAADWFFSQREFVVTHGIVRWRDQQRQGVDAPVLTLSDVDLVVKNQWGGHALRMDATPPSAVGQRLALRGKFHHQPLAPPGDVGHWRGELFADMPHVDVSALRQWLPLDAQVSVPQGRGALRVWLDVAQGQVTGVTADVALQEVEVQLAPALRPLGLRHVNGRVGAKWFEQGGKPAVEVSSQDLVFDTLAGEHWPGGALRLGWQGEGLETGSFSADQLDVEAVAQISQRLPLPEAWRSALARLQPKGRLNTLQASWQTLGAAGPTPQHNYSLKGSLEGLQLLRDPQADSAWAAVPGIHGADIDFDLTQQGGKAQLRIAHGSLTLPQGLDDPQLWLDQALVQMAWQSSGDAWTVQVSQGQVANADLAGEFSGSWTSGDAAHRWPGVLDLTASIRRAQAQRLHRYLPNALPLEVRAYVRDAVQQGEASKATLRIRGDLNHLPFDNPALGELRLSTQIDQGRFAYVPVAKNSRAPATANWPALSDIHGELVFERSGLHFKGSTRVEGADHVPWQKVDVRIANFARPEVQVSGEARGPVSEVLGVVSHSALNDLTGEVLQDSQASGLADYKLSMKLPLAALATSKVQGSVSFLGNELQVMPGTPVLAALRGQLQFSEQGFKLKDLKARALGGDAQIDGGLALATPAPESPLQLKIKGRLSAEGLRQARELGWVTRLAAQASGSTSYDVTVGLRRGQPELLISSDLRGLALSLPAPLNKTAATALPLRVSTQLTRESLPPKSRSLQDQLTVSLGRVLAVNYLRDLSGQQPQVVRGGIAVGQAVNDNLPLRDKGVSLNLQLPALDVDAWSAVMGDVSGVPLREASRSPSALKPLASPSDAGVVPDYLPTWLTLRADQLTLTERAVHNVSASGTRQGELWRLNIRADELNGAVEVRPASGNTPAQLLARLTYLNIPPSLVSDVERMLSEQPSSIPALDIVVEDLTLRNKKLGRLEIQAINRTGSNASREWRLNTFNLSMPEASFTAQGNWAADGPNLRRTQLTFVLDLNDSGQLLTRLGTPDAIRAGKGRLEGQVSWLGSPITLDYPSMSGKLNLAVEKGQFLKTEPGAARLLGVLNLQALPRRLALDFSDIFSEGFAFDFVRGDVRIDQGVAFTNNLQMKGVVAGALIEGRADLARETQDLKVVVVPEINAGTYSLYMATINPLVGLTSYLAQLVLAKPLVRANTSEFHVDGTWVNPRVTKVE